MRLIATLATLALFAVAAQATVLTDENFDEVTAGKTVFVKFFAPWCGHCKQLAPEWEEAAQRLAGSVKLGAVDATENGQLAQKYGVQGYPTIKLFPAGKKSGKPKDYNGARDAQGIVDYSLRTLDEAGVRERLRDALCDLNLHGNRLGGRGAAAIADVLRPNQRRFNRALTVLYLNLNDLGEQDKAALKRVAAARASLTIHL